MVGMENTLKPEIAFFCIGVGNAGSTWLTECLSEHPEITISLVKEPNFFVRRLSVFGGEENPGFMKSWKWYTRQYRQGRKGQILGDCSINLIHNVPEAPELIKKYYPEAKFIAILRDPVKRTYSHYWYEKRFSRIPNVPETFGEAVKNEELLRRSRYFEHLRAWLSIFPEEQFHFVLDIDLQTDTPAVLQSLYSFLGVDPTFQAPSTHRKMNIAASAHPLFVKLSKLLKWGRLQTIDFPIYIMRGLGLTKLVRRMLVTAKPYPAMSAEIKQRLREYFLPDIVQLEELIHRNLDSWKEG